MSPEQSRARDVAAPQLESSGARPPWALLPILAIALLWRLPSFFDPPWVNDEGTYFAIAQAMSHGFRLYRDVWENKPPALYIFYSAVYHSFGASLIAIRAIVAVAVLLLIVLVYRIARLYAVDEAALAAAMLAGLLLGVPFLEGTTGNAEVFLALLSAAGVYLTLGQGRAAAGGIAMGGAVLFKAVAGFDALALGLWLLNRRRSRVWRYAVAVAAVLLGAALAALLSGIFVPMLRDAVLYDLGYVGRKNGAGIPWILLLKVGMLMALSLLVRSRPFPWLWTLYAAAGALVSGRFFGHYALQVVAPLSVLAASLLRDRTSLARRLLAVLPLSFLTLAGVSALAGFLLASSGHNTILARRLQWYANAIRYSIGNETRATYWVQVDDHVRRNLQVVSRLAALPPGRILVWGNTPWIYVLAHRDPATPYTSALRDPAVPGEASTLRAALRACLPREVVVIRPPAPPLAGAQRALHRCYRSVDHVDNATIYVSR